MKKITFTLFLVCSILYAYGQQGCDSDRYFNTVFENVTVTSNVQYGQNITIGGNAIELKMDIYEPEGDVLEKRPLIVFAHGGGFVSGNKEVLVFSCTNFAKKGFVTASISYRLIDAPIPDSLTAVGILMAIHDMKAAVRFFREDAATADNYRIDPDFIFAGGISAGAIMASTVGYLDSTDNIAPPIQAIINALGGLEGNSSSNTQYSSEVQGVLNYSGALPEVSYIDANDPPLYSFHDEFDTVVPCGYEPLINQLQGSCLMHDVAESVGIKNQFYLRSENDSHVDWSYGTILYESTQFLGEILCENAPDSPWEEVGSGLETPGFLAYDISVVDENIHWVIPLSYSASQQFSKTTDGGQSWMTGTISVNNPSFGVIGIQGFDGNTAMAMMLSFPDEESGKMYKTTDGGLSWTEQSTSFVNPNEGPQVFHFFNENDGFALGHLIDQNNSLLSSHVGYVTSDGGTNWEKLGSDVYPAAPGERLFVNDTKYMGANGDHLWFGTSTGKIYHSSDRGQTWEVLEVEAFTAIQSVAFKDELNGIAVTGNDAFGTDISKAFSTSDGGVSWTELDVPTTPRTTGIYFVEGSADEANSCGTYIMFNGHYSISGSSYSNDGGQSWNLISEQPVFDIEFINPETGWMGGMIHSAEEGGLYKWAGESLAGEASCITGTKEQIVQDESLSVFPNPASESVSIQLDNDWQGALNLRIVNTLGQVIITKNLEKHKGAANWEFDLQNLSPGAYHALISDGKKLIIEKLIKI